MIQFMYGCLASIHNMLTYYLSAES